MVHLGLRVCFSYLPLVTLIPAVIGQVDGWTDNNTVKWDMLPLVEEASRQRPVTGLQVFYRLFRFGRL